MTRTKPEPKITLPQGRKGYISLFFPCHYGIDFSTRGELIASNKSVSELKDFLGLDSLSYLSLNGLLTSTGVENPENNFCKACFDGCYPVEFDELLSKDCLEKR